MIQQSLEQQAAKLLQKEHQPKTTKFTFFGLAFDDVCHNFPSNNQPSSAVGSVRKYGKCPAVAGGEGDPRGHRGGLCLEEQAPGVPREAGRARGSEEGTTGGEGQAAEAERKITGLGGKRSMDNGELLVS